MYPEVNHRMHLLLFLVLSAAKQIRHDAIEQQIWNHLQRQKDSIMDRWPHAGHRLLSDFHKASKCYVQFHLQKVSTCDAALSAVDRDLTEQMERGVVLSGDSHSDDHSLGGSDSAISEH
jgi:HPt (histidine-containing phosphotransfer) domain-containing protein